MTNEFDLHIDYSHSYYDGDSNTSCTMTITDRAKRWEPIVVEYDDRWGDLSEKEIIHHIVKDIAEYIFDPESWRKAYMVRTSNLGAQLAEAQHEAEQDRKKIADYEQALAYRRKNLLERGVQIAQLQAQLAKEQEC